MGKILWTEQEEMLLVDMVLAQEDFLFGPLTGCNFRDKCDKREEEWQNICQVLNSQFTSHKRVVEKVKKKWQNLKQRLKEKVDERRKHIKSTGGGPQLPQLSNVEEALVQRPGIRGLQGGIDTDAQSECEDGFPAEENLMSSSEFSCNNPGPSQSNRTDSSKHKTVDIEVSGLTQNKVIGLPQREKVDLPQASKVPKLSEMTSITKQTPEVIGTNNLDGNGKKGTHKGKRKNSRTEVEEENLKNIRLDNERIEGEIMLQQEKIKTLTSQREMMDAVKLYFHYKTQVEFTSSFIACDE